MVQKKLELECVKKRFTSEQQEIIDTILEYPIALIYALAGTGKTTVLLAIARKYSLLKGLYLVFNKANKDEAALKFPKNFKASNIHSFAYYHLKRYGAVFMGRLRKKNYKEVEIARILSISSKDSKRVLKIFNRYLNSSLSEIPQTSKFNKLANRLYSLMRESEIDCTHNFYLKEFELLLKKKNIVIEFDILMLDEAQDTNMVTLSICSLIMAKNKVFVGDDNQQIYSFRDSVNAMDKLNNPKKFYLQETFRFPAYNTFYANTLLRRYKNSKIELKSNLAVDDKYDLQGKSDEYCNEIELQSNERCYISRTNSILIFKMIELTNQNRVFKTIRHPNEIFSLALEIYYLSVFRRKEIWQNKFLLDYDNIGELESYAKSIDDIEILSALGICDKYGAMLEQLKIKAEEYYNDFKFNEKKYKDFLTTAHTCKGLEWDYVSIEDSFSDFIGNIVKSGYFTMKEFRDNIKVIDSNIVDEFNLFYVAATRSKKSMQILDANKFYLDISEEETDTLIAAYKKALDDFNNGESESFEYNPREILGYDCLDNNGSLEYDQNQESENILIDNNEYIQDCKDGSVVNFVESYGMEKPLPSGDNEDKNKKEFDKYTQGLINWQPCQIDEGKLLINGKKQKDSNVTVGVKIGNGNRIHPMKISLDTNNLIVSNNTKWQKSKITIVDTLDEIPSHLISKVSSLEKPIKLSV